MASSPHQFRQPNAVHDRRRAADESSSQGKSLNLFGGGRGADGTAEKQITTIFFDLDNTLIPTRKGDAKACSKVAEYLIADHGVPRELATEAATNFLTALRRCPDNPSFTLAQWRTQMWTDCLPAAWRHLAPQVYSRWLEYRTRYMTPSEDIFAMLETLRRRYQLGIITNGPSAAQWEKVDRLGMGRFFDCILVSSDLPWAKPDRNIFYAGCHYLGVQPEQCVMIGDKLETDVQGGVEAKLGITVWLPLPKDLQLAHDKIDLSELDDHIRPDFIVHDVLDLPSILPEQQQHHHHRGGAAPLEDEDGNWEDWRDSGSFVQKTTRNRSASYNRFLPDVPDLFSSSSNSCDSSGSY
uniref:N-acylneuraminate-9-phosphatase n=1 Tax=Culex tarsalis TaxID=7177 RepID=A0A1Q3FI31_CULTA